MTIVNPISITSPAAQASNIPVATSEERQVGLRLDQIVRATVVEGGLDRILLEMNQRHYQAQSELELQTGQKLTLQVLQTHPKLEFRVLPEQLNGRLSQLLPLLSRAYDWGGLVGQLQQQPGQAQLPVATTQVFNQLQQLFQAGPATNPGLHEQITTLAGQLHQLADVHNGIPRQSAAPHPANPQVYQSQTALLALQAQSAQQPPDLSRLVQQLQVQLAQLPKVTGQPVPVTWETQTHELLRPFLPLAGQLQGQNLAPQLLELQAVLQQIHRQPNLTPQLSRELEQLLGQLAAKPQPLPTNPQLLESSQLAAGPLPQRESGLSHLIQGLQLQLSLLPKVTEQSLSIAWEGQTREMLQALQQTLERAPGPTALQHQTQLPAPQLVELQAVLRQIQQQPNFPPVLGNDLERLLAQLHANPLVARPLLATGNDQNYSAPQSGGRQAAQAVFASAAASMPAKDVIAGLEKLLVQVQEVQIQQKGLPPALLGRLEGLLDKICQLPPASEVAFPALSGLPVIAEQLNQLVHHSNLRPEGGPLGLLSQLFGFHLETELLAGKKKAALASLKLSLLNLREELAGKAEEPLQRLELFQFCKARLAEEQVQFLPLLMAELQEGYLLVEKQPEPDDDEEGEPPLQLSLSLRLSALGNLRVDMLYEKQAVHLRLACEDTEKMHYLQAHVAGLEKTFTAVPLRGVSFAADAQVASRQLLERLVPESSGVLDDRV